MTEEQYLNGTNPAPMLAFAAGKVSDRKLLLFVAACLRRIRPWLPDARCQRLITTIEQLGEGLAEPEQAIAAHEAVQAACDRGQIADRAGGKALEALSDGLQGLAAGGTEMAGMVAYGASEVFGYLAAMAGPRKLEAWADAWTAGREAEWRVQAELLRDITGPLPFREVSIQPHLLHWQDGMIVRLAAAAYTARERTSGWLDNTRLAVLADALEEAGCKQAEVLHHLRGAGSHVPGCWCLDLIRGQR